jgi:hypothetical protein
MYEPTCLIAAVVTQSPNEHVCEWYMNIHCNKCNSQSKAIRCNHMYESTYSRGEYNGSYMVQTELYGPRSVLQVH